MRKLAAGLVFLFLMGARILGVAQIGPGRLLLGARDLGAAAAARAVMDAALLERSRRRLRLPRRILGRESRLLRALPTSSYIDRRNLTISAN
jgi:hypothetical protein